MVLPRLVDIVSAAWFLSLSQVLDFLSLPSSISLIYTRTSFIVVDTPEHLMLKFFRCFEFENTYGVLISS